MRRIVSLVAVIVCTLTLSAQAQTTTGRILGQVSDSAGNPMVGVTVTVTSDELMGGERSAVTGETGAYRITALPHGSYDVTVRMEGYQTQSTQGVRVSLGGSASIDFEMQPQFSQEVTVTGESPLVDTAASGPSATYTAAFLENLPTTRNFYDVMMVSPGVSTAYEDADRMVIAGSNQQSNNWFIDGIEFTAPETGTAWIYSNPDAVEEIQVMHIGAPAEYGNMLGGALNVVTKSGSNEFKGGVNVFWFDDSLVDSNINFDSEFPEYVQNEFWDITATLGGPIVKDRLWFFLGFEDMNDNRAYPGSDPDITEAWYSDKYDLKLSASLSQNHLVDAKVYYSEWGFPEAASEYYERSALAGEIGDDRAWGINYQGVLTDRLFIEARYAGWKSVDDNLSQTGSTEHAYIDNNPPGGGPPRYWGGVWWPWTYDTSLDQVSASVSYFADEFIKGSHDFKFGVQASRGDAVTQIAPSATGIYYYHYTYEYDYYGTIYPYDYYYRVVGVPYFYGNDQESISVFADDSWRVSDRLTVNLGLRFDHHVGVIPPFPRLDGDGNPTGEMIPGVDPVFTWDNWSPRLGFAYTVGAEMNTVIRGSFGYYFDGNVSGNWNSPPPLSPTLTAYVGESWDGPFDEVAWEWEWGLNNVDPNLKAPLTLQYSIGFETAINNKYSFGVTALYKDTSDLVGWEIMDDGVYEEMEFTDPFTGREYTLLDPIEFPTVRKGNKPGFTINPDATEYWQEYWGLILTFSRRFTDFWSMQASYTYSESTGLIPRFLEQEQFNPFYGENDGSDPNSYLNANDQRLQGDRPHMLRVLAHFSLPHNFRISTNINLQNGRPYSRQIELPTTDHPAAIMEPASDDLRHPFQSLVDVGVGKSFGLPGDTELNVDLQFFNIFNNTATDWFETLVLNPGDTFVPNTWVKPRRLMLRVGFQF
jgi:hypothetical protein